MKKITLTLIMLCMAFMAFTQVAMFEAPQGGSSRFTHDFTCMPDYVYSQIPSNLNAGIYCDVNYTYTKVAADYTASASFNSMKFWGHHVTHPVESFLIEFYNGIPGQAGTSVIQSINIDITPVATGYNSDSGFPVFEFNAFFSTITQLTGWVSISRTNVPATDTFTWTGNSGTGNSLSYNQGTGVWDANYTEPAFCLGNAGTIPVSNWALIIGLGLIVTFTIIRLRKA